MGNTSSLEPPSVAALVVPGAGAVSDVLAQILSLCREKEDAKEMFVRVHERLNDIYMELLKMEREQQRLPSRDRLWEYTQLLDRYLKDLTRSQGAESAKRPREMTDELFALNEDIDRVVDRLKLTTTVGALTQWRQQWEDDAPHARAKRLKQNHDAPTAATTRVPATVSLAPPSSQRSPGDEATHHNTQPSIASLVALLQNGSDDQKEKAAATICSLALTEANQVLIAEAGAIAPLVVLVKNGNGVQKANAAIALWALAMNAVNQVAITEAEGIAPLVALTKKGTETQKENASAALWNLAINAANQVAIADASGIESLVALVSSDNDIQKEKAAGALCNLAANEFNQFAIVKAGGIAPLVALVTYGNDIQKENAAAALSFLAVNTANHGAIADAGGIGSLVELATSGNEIQKKNAAAALRNFPVHTANHGAVSDADARLFSCSSQSTATRYKNRRQRRL